MAANMIELLQASAESSRGENLSFKKIVQSCLEYGTFYSQDSAETVTKIINSSLNSSFDKENGLILLQNLLPQISIEAFSNNAVSWMVSCTKIISQKEGVSNVLAFEVLTNLIKLSPKFPEINKETAKQIVPKLLGDHIKRRTNPQISVELLECLHSCISKYPGPSGEFRLDIMKLLLNVVESHDEVVAVASRCFPLVAAVGGGGKQGVSHKAAWRQQQMALVALLHSLLNQLYEHIDYQAEEPVASEDIQLNVEAVTDRNILTRSQRLAKQFTSVCLFLQAMLLGEFPVPKAVAPDAILDVVSHAQKPTLANLGSSREALAVTSVLPTIQVAALRLLESLVLCLGRNLVPRGALVCYLCSQVIHWTHQQHPDWPYAMERPFSQTRLAVYCCLHSWLTVAGLSSQLETVIDKLLPPMLVDIHAEKPTVRLRVGSKAGKGRKKQQMLVNLEDRSEKLGDVMANRRLCERALKTLALLLQTTMTRLKPETVSSIMGTVLQLAADLPVPYSDASALVALYQLLLTLCLEPHPRLSPPLAPALAIFTSGAHHPASSVRATCVTALSGLEKVVHPTAATLYFPANLDKKKQSRELEEDSVPSPKRMRVDTDPSDEENVTSIVPGISENAPSVKLKDEDDIEEVIINSDDSSGTGGVVEGNQEVNIAQNITSEAENEYGTSDEEIDVVELTEGDETCIGNVEKTPQEKSSELSGMVTYVQVSSQINGNKKEDTCLDMEREPGANSNNVAEPGKSEGETCLTYDHESTVTELGNPEDDADVTQMLKDFTDEVNDDTQH